MGMIGSMTHAQVRNIMRNYEIARNTVTVTYMTGGVHIHGCGYDIRLRSLMAVLYVLAHSGKSIKVEYSTQPIGAVAD